ncbi:isoaspartyl peptidase/L-asparaginase [Paractinoplanes maris]|uniref:isoaspartyl peptidase/L-asparaginase n=1 Tax=Paractinoplanes maris TaxID=1734446 RepID=UPI002020D3FB|nr:isoaspartyl peptidase/L-asparaginase [Actinoplanes maris]
MGSPVIIASERGEVGLVEAMRVLRAGGSAMDAVEIALRAAEANEADHYVGVGGLPNLLGEVELDASIMDGATMAAGAVGAVTGFPHPITVARAVMEQLPQHVMLVGRGAERFADECGIPRGTTLTDEAIRLWKEGLTPDSLAEAERTQGPGEVAFRRSALARLQSMEPPHRHPWGTINVVALDREGRLCTGVSTSGYPWKYPGRVGDSAVIGAGNYCDGRYGGAACTGRGELAMRGHRPDRRRRPARRPVPGSGLRERAGADDGPRRPLPRSGAHALPHRRRPARRRGHGDRIDLRPDDR